MLRSDLMLGKYKFAVLFIICGVGGGILDGLYLLVTPWRMNKFYQSKPTWARRLNLWAMCKQVRMTLGGKENG